MALKPIPVRDMHTGERWESITAAAEAIGVTRGALAIAIQGHRSCNGRWIVIDGEEPVLCECCKAEIKDGVLPRKKLAPTYGSTIKDEVASMVG